MQIHPQARTTPAVRAEIARDAGPRWALGVASAAAALTSLVGLRHQLRSGARILSVLQRGVDEAPELTAERMDG